MSKTLKRFFTYLSLATLNVEQNALSNMGNDMSDNNRIKLQKEVDNLASDLIQGRVTREVELLRSRMYKVIKESSKLKLEFDGKRVGSSNTIDNIKAVKKSVKDVITEPSDKYKLIMAINNTPYINSVADTLNLSQGQIDDYSVGSEYKIILDRDITPKFKLEDYTKKLHVKHIKDDEYLLEFWVSKYKDKYNKKSGFFLNALQKIQDSPKTSDILDFKSVEFITQHDYGVEDFMYFNFSMESYDKIVEYDGYYIIKIKSKVISNKSSVIDKFVDKELEEKYANNEKRGIL